MKVIEQLNRMYNINIEIKYTKFLFLYVLGYPMLIYWLTVSQPLVMYFRYLKTQKEINIHTHIQNLLSNLCKYLLHYCSLFVAFIIHIHKLHMLQWIPKV